MASSHIYIGGTTQSLVSVGTETSHCTSKNQAPKFYAATATSHRGILEETWPVEKGRASLNFDNGSQQV